MSSDNTVSLARRLALGDLEHELGITRRLLERLPNDRMGWKPHERSMSLGELATHLANLVFWQTMTVAGSEFDLAAAPPPLRGAASRDEVLQRYDENVVDLERALGSMDDSALAEPWTLRNGEQVVLKRPRAAVLRLMGISHMVHHRGQLSVYLRMLDVPVPAIYGPSADERPQF